MAELRVAMVVPVAPVTGGLDAELERTWPSVEHARALVKAGAEVHLFVASHQASITTLPGDVVLHRVQIHHRRALAPELAFAIRRLAPDVVHAFHFRAVPMLASLLILGQRVVGEFNGGTVPTEAWKRLAFGRALSRCAAICFTAEAQADPFRALADFRVFETPEVSSRFPAPTSPGEARARSGFEGDPLVLVVARIEHPKDPWCTLAAFELILKKRPGARMLWIDRSGADRAAIEEAIRSRSLGRAIEIRGTIDRATLLDAYSSADVMLHTSRREICGHAYMEALSMGLPIAASDIPAFRRWHPEAGVQICPVGDASAFAEAALALVDRPALRAEVRGYFERELAYGVIGRRRYELYRAQDPGRREG